MSTRKMNLVILIASLFLFHVSCGGGFSPKGTGSGGGGSTAPAVSFQWDFDLVSNYNLTEGEVEVSGGQARVLLQSFEIDDAADFGGGTLIGAVYDGVTSNLTIDSGSATNELTANNSPQFSELVGYWTFEGNFNDSSTELNNGTAVGDAVGDTAVFKVGAESLLLDGAGDYITVPDDDSLDLDMADQLTLSTWIKYPTVGSTDRILAKGCFDGTNWVDLSYMLNKNNDESVSFSISADGVTIVNLNSGITLRPNLWYHIASTYDGATMSIYINGELVNTGAHTGNVFNGAQELNIGTRRDGPGCASFTQYFEGNIDDVAIWKQSLTADEVSQVFHLQKQRYHAIFESAVIDSGSSLSPWPRLAWETPRPYFKEFPGDTTGDGTTESESVGGRYPLVAGSGGEGINNNNMSQLIMLLRLNNEAGPFTGVAGEMADSSGQTNAANASGGSINTESAIFYQGVYVDGSAIHIDVPGFVSNPDFTDAKTISFWLKIDPNQVDTVATTNTIILDGDGTRSLKIGYHNSTALPADIGKVFLEVDDSVTTLSLTSTSRIDDGNFHLVTAVHTTTPGLEYILYIDGAPEANIANTTVGSYGGAYTFSIGDAVENFSGVIDEVAVWARGLHEKEVEQAYRRGANRVKFLVKSCADPACICQGFGPGGSATDCDGDGNLNGVDTSDAFFATWLGVDNSSSKPFSELVNNTAISASGQGSGFVNVVSPTLDFADFAGSGFTVSNNQYFQFKIDLESENNISCDGVTCLPQVTNVSIASNNFFGGPQAISATNSFSYASTVVDISFNEVGGANCNFEYQLSNDDGVTWYYYSTGSSSWILAAGPTDTSNESEIRSGISTFHTVPGTRDFTFKAFIESVDTTTSCTLDQVSASFTAI